MPGVKLDVKSLFSKAGYIAFFENYKNIPTTYDKVYKKVEISNGGDGDKETMLLGLGNLEERTDENAMLNFKSPVQAWVPQVKYREFTGAFAISKATQQNSIKIKDLAKRYGSSWAQGSIIAKEELGASVFNNGGNTAGHSVFDADFTDNAQNYTAHMIYDSKPLFNLTGNARKLFSQVTGIYYNAVISLSVCKADFETLYTLASVTNAVDERGNKVDLGINTLLTEEGANARLAFQLLESDMLPGSQMNDKNPYKGIVKPLAWRYLDDSGAFYVGKAQSDDFQFRVNQQPEIRYFRDEMTLGYKGSFNEEFGIFIKNWRTWARGGGTYA